MFRFVRKATLDRVLDDADRRIGEAEARRAEANNEWRKDYNELADKLTNCRTERTELIARLDIMRAELAQTWIRNARGHLVRHPSYVAPK